MQPVTCSKNVPEAKNVPHNDPESHRIFPAYGNGKNVLKNDKERGVSSSSIPEHSSPISGNVPDSAVSTSEDASNNDSKEGRNSNSNSNSDSSNNSNSMSEGEGEGENEESSSKASSYVEQDSFLSTFPGSPRNRTSFEMPSFVPEDYDYTRSTEYTYALR